MSARANQVLHFAQREADLYRAEQIAPEHLLIGILREGEGTAMQVLMRLNVDFWKVRAQVTRNWRRGG